MAAANDLAQGKRWPVVGLSLSLLGYHDLALRKPNA
jgi:hypothetical protein